MTGRFVWTPERRAAFQAVLDAKRRLDAERQQARERNKEGEAAGAPLPLANSLTVVKLLAL